MQDIAPKEQRQVCAVNTRARRYLAAVLYYPLRMSVIALVMLPLTGATLSHRGGEGRLPNHVATMRPDKAIDPRSDSIGMGMALASPLTHPVRDITIYKDGCGAAECVSPSAEDPPRCADCDWPPVCYAMLLIIFFLILLLLTLLPKPVPITPAGKQKLIEAIKLRFRTLREDAERFGLAQSIPLLDRAENEVIAEINSLK